MEAALGLSLGLGIVVIAVWLIRRDSQKSVDLAISRLNENLARLREESLRYVQEEIDEEAITLESTTPNAKFDWLFEDKDGD